MGNFCSGGKEEKKASAFASAEDSDALQHADPLSSGASSNIIGDSSQFDGGTGSHHGLAPSAALQQDALQNNNSATSPATSAANEAQLLERREEQNRLDVIVQTAGRGMVSVRSTRGSTGYYDQGFAAALGQHLEQTTTFPDQLPIRLPATSSKGSSNSSHNGTSGSSSSTTAATTTVFQRLSQPQWENIALGNKGTGLAGCGGENPNTYLDHVAVSFLDSVVPKKERIFHGGVGPMVENLL